VTSEVRLIELTCGRARAEIDVEHGGRIAQITVSEQPLLWTDTSIGAIGWGSFPMAPWVGRIRAGRFEFDDTDYQLDLNHVDVDGACHAIHGTVYTEPWTLDDASPDVAELHCDLGSWPWRGVARQRIELSESGIRCELTVESTEVAFPAAIGWHPWFVKPDRLTFTPSKMYRRGDIGLPTAELVEPADGPWDDTFMNDDPVTLHYDDDGRRHARSVVVTSDCDHFVVYDQPPFATCIEPQSGPPDALTMQPRMVGPDEPLTRWMQITWA
jgi:aldose 1-epimerase